jgi:transposase InsO family protein
MSLRLTIVEVDTTKLNVTEFCAQHNVSTWFFWDLRRKYAIGGLAAIEPKSRAPRQVANKTPVEIEDAIVAMRKELDDAGLDAGPATIAFHLRALDALPSESTIWRILKARGFIVDDPSKAPKAAGKRFTAERANECWQLDDTGWELADGTEVKILNVLDDHSRLLVASVAMDTCTGAKTLTALLRAAPVLGLPQRFLSDNAKAFRHVLATALAELGVAASHSRPFHPQTNGKVERFHQTLKKRLHHQPNAATIDELQDQLDAFRHLYNHQRPHRSINRDFPAAVWARAPRSGPGDRPLTATTATWTSTVSNGMAWAGNRYRITIGSTHNGSQATTVLTGTNCHIFIDGRLIRALTIDPTRQHQRLHDRPGRPTQLP